MCRAAFLLLVSLALLGAPRASWCAAPAPIVARAVRAARLLDWDGAPLDSARSFSPDSPQAIRSLDGLARELDRHLALHPRDCDALVARARVENLRWESRQFEAISHAAASHALLPMPPVDDPRPRIAAWLGRAHAVRPTSGEPAFWLAYVYSDEAYVEFSRMSSTRLALDLPRAVVAAREAVRLDPGRRYARALLVADLLLLGEDAEAEVAARGPAGATDLGSAQIAVLLKDRDSFAVPPGARYEPKLRDLFAHGGGIAGAEDASEPVTLARTACYVLAGDVASTAKYYEGVFPGFHLLRVRPDSAMASPLPMSDIYVGELRWSPDGALIPLAAPDPRDRNARDVLDLLIVKFDYSTMLGLPADSLALRKQVTSTLLYFTDRRRLAP